MASIVRPSSLGFGSTAPPCWRATSPVCWRYSSRGSTPLITTHSSIAWRGAVLVNVKTVVLLNRVIRGQGDGASPQGPSCRYARSARQGPCARDDGAGPLAGRLSASVLRLAVRRGRAAARPLRNAGRDRSASSGQPSQVR